MGDSVFVNGRAAVHKRSSGKSVAAPDVCLCPPGPPAGPVPTPLVNTVVAADMDGGTSTVLVEGNPQGTRQSFFRKSTGNEVARATGGGVLTGVVQGQAKFRFGYSRNVYIEGEPAVRHLDPLTHNHAGFAGNTPPAPWVSKMDPDVPRMPPRTVLIDEAERAGFDFIEIKLVDENNLPLEPTRYRLTIPTGRTHEGRTLGLATVKVTGLTSGTCRLELPQVDRKWLSARQPALLAVGANQVPYKPGNVLTLATGKIYQVVVPGLLSFWLDLPLDTRDVRTRDDRFILKSTDGSYEVVRTIKDDRIRADRALTLEFPGLRPGLCYSLVHEPGAEGVPVALFTDRSFEDLFRAPTLDESLSPEAWEDR
jgi:hypothetical protein